MEYYVFSFVVGVVFVIVVVSSGRLFYICMFFLEVWKSFFFIIYLIGLLEFRKWLGKREIWYGQGKVRGFYFEFGKGWKKYLGLL